MNADFATIAAIEEREAVDAATFEREVLPGYRPIVLRGQISDWPAVAAGRAGPRATAEYLARFASAAPVDVMIGPPAIAGRFFYVDDMNGFNFTRQPVPLPALIAQLAKLVDAPDGYALYAGAAAAEEHLPGWIEANPMRLPLPDAVARVWIGNATHVSTHHDTSNNLACVVAGARRFTLFPPDQIDNLYVGPLDVTMAGQPASMVDPGAPNLGRYPRFAEALKHARTAELGPGDAIFIPSLWWHDVRASGPFNVLVNYWSEPAGAASAFPALVHALMAIRELPSAERAAWRGWFDHYVFDDAAEERATAHLPAPAHGVLGPASPERTTRIAQFLIRALGRR